MRTFVTLIAFVFALSACSKDAAAPAEEVAPVEAAAEAAAEEATPAATEEAAAEAEADAHAGHAHACECGKGKDGGTAWCDGCGVGFINGEKTADKAKVDAALAAN